MTVVVYFCFVCQKNQGAPLPLHNGEVVTCLSCGTTYDVQVGRREDEGRSHPVYAFTQLTAGAPPREEEVLGPVEGEGEDDA